MQNHIAAAVVMLFMAVIHCNEIFIEIKILILPNDTCQLMVLHKQSTKCVPLTHFTCWEAARRILCTSSAKLGDVFWYMHKCKGKENDFPSTRTLFMTH